MPVTLERQSRKWPPATLVVIGLLGVGAAVLAYTSSHNARPAGPASPDLAASSAISGAPDPTIHVPLFVNPALVRPTPRFRFTFDPPEALAELRQEERLDDVVGGAAGDLERVVALMRWTRAQWEPGIPSPYPPLNARVVLGDIRRKFTGGFDAQYNQVLVQALQSFGIPARYISVEAHEVVEARLPDEGRWICFDPLYTTYYKDEADRPLSVLEIHGRVRSGKAVLLSDAHLVADPARQVTAFRSFAVWLKNDHISAPVNFADLERYKIYFLDDPGAARGIPPGALATTEPADLYPG
jgi:hypothetical protein